MEAFEVYHPGVFRRVKAAVRRGKSVMAFKENVWKEDDELLGRYLLFLAEHTTS